MWWCCAQTNRKIIHYNLACVVAMYRRTDRNIIHYNLTCVVAVYRKTETSSITTWLVLLCTGKQPKTSSITTWLVLLLCAEKQTETSSITFNLSCCCVQENRQKHHPLQLTYLVLLLCTGKQTDSGKLLWLKAGQQGRRWISQQVNIHNINSKWRIVFVGAREHKTKVIGSFGNFITGDIAIDDISFTEGACPGTSCPDRVPNRDICLNNSK